MQKLTSCTKTHKDLDTTSVLKYEIIKSDLKLHKLGLYYKLTLCTKTHKDLDTRSVLKYEIVKSDLKLHKLGLYHVHKISQTLFTLKPV